MSNQITYSLAFNPDSDSDIIDWLRSQTNKQAAIKSLIRAEINRRSENESVPDLYQMFADMRTYLDDKFAHIHAITSIPIGPRNTTIDPEFKQAIKAAVRPGFVKKPKQDK